MVSSVDLNGIWGNVFRLDRRKNSLLDVLREVPLFADLSPRELRVLEEAVHVRTFAPGEPVFSEGDAGAAMYVIQSGKVDVMLRRGSYDPILLAELVTGDFFGEMALLGDSIRSAGAVAREGSTVIGFSHPDLAAIIEVHPRMGARICLGLAKTLAERLRYTNGQLRDIWDIRSA
ncbi:MAG TPA: cyclic nucleotide-binding domain-containing protein [Terriglobia bacterium]|nr:cyclic nucleotide-binding domain-containing protein [Terriglobia bacterium]